MLTINDIWDAIFLGCFFFGLLFALATLLVGGLDIGIHGHGDGGGHGHDVGGLVPINVGTVLAFIAWFGGVAYLARDGLGWPALVSAIVGLVGGAIGAAAIGWFLVRVIRPNDRPLDPEDFRLPGTIARVSSSIREGGTGEVIYEQAGVRQVAAARSDDGRAIGRGSEVVVLRSDRGVVLVEPSGSFFDEPADFGDSMPRFDEVPAPSISTIDAAGQSTKRTTEAG